MTTKPRVLYLDNTALRTLICDTRAVVRNVLGFTTPSESLNLRAGLDCHAVLERFFKGKSIPVSMRPLERTYRPWITQMIDDGNRVEERFFADNVETIMRSWMETHPVHAFPFDIEPDYVEVGVGAPLTAENTCVCGALRDDHVGGMNGCEDTGCPKYAEIVFVGKLDVIGITKDTRELVPIDHKTTGNLSAHFIKKFFLDSQISGYIWLCEQHTGKKVRNAYINAIEIRVLPSSSKKCAEHKVAYAECGHLHVKSRLIGPVLRSAYQLAEWKRTALVRARRYNELLVAREDRMTLKGVRMNGTFNDACVYCDFSSFCEQDRPATSFSNGELKHEPWDPAAHVGLAIEGASK